MVEAAIAKINPQRNGNEGLPFTAARDCLDSATIDITANMLYILMQVLLCLSSIEMV